MSTEAAKNAPSGKDSPVIVGDHPEDSQTSQDVPRSALGIVSESGEIVNDAGDAVGNIGDSKDPKDLVGKTVNSTGDILGSTGEVLGQAVLGGSGDEHENTDSAYSLVGSSEKKKDDDSEQNELHEEAEKPQTKSETQFDGEDQDIPINLKDNEATDKVADAPKEAEGAAEDLKEVPAEPEADDVKETVDDVKDAPAEKAEAATEDVKDKAAEPEAQADEAKGTTEDAAEGVKETTDDTKEKLADDAEVPSAETDTDKPVDDLKKDAPVDEKDIPDKDAAEDKLPEAGDDKAGDEEKKQGEETVAEGQEAAQETAEGAEEKTSEATDLAKGATGAAAETAQEKTEEAVEGAEGAKDETAETAEKKTDETVEGAEGAKDELAEKAEQTTDETAETAEKKTDETAEDVEGAKDESAEAAEKTTDETAEGAKDELAEKAEQTTDETAETAEQKTDDAAETAEEATDKVDEEGNKLDFSILKGTKVNKAGNLVNSNGDIIGKVVEGEPKKLLGKRADENGDIWDDAGKKVGKGEPLPDSERENSKDFAPFENFPDATVEADGKVTSEGRQVGVVVEGDPKRLKGSKVDEDGDILDRRGNVVGKAEAWDEPEPIPEEPEAVVDKSALAGKRVNKLGNVVDGSGVIYGRIIEGNLQSMIGRMCDKEGNVRSESGDILGKAELVPEGEREGSKEGPFAELSGLTVSKDGKVVTPSGDVVGRLISGDAKTLAGRSVDEDGEVTDRNGNVLAKAERWSEPEVEKKKDFLAGRKVNKEGNVVDEDGNIIGKLVTGELAICSGKEIDDDGDVVNSKGQSIGHVSRLEDIPAEPEKEPEETAEEKAAREEAAEKKKLADNDNELARRLGYVIEETLGKMNPICEKITHKIEAEERKPKEERDEEELVKQVRPLIEEGGKILTETNGAIRGMDPDGRIQRNAKHKSGTKEASPEEHHLAEVLKELTGSVTKCIDGAKKKIDDMPHAKKELSPLWGLLADPLVQILAAVGLLLNGVLGLVGRLLNMLGLGGIVDGILGGLGINKLLTGLGLGDVVGTLTGKNSKDGKQKKGLFG